MVRDLFKVVTVSSWVSVKLLFWLWVVWRARKENHVISSLEKVMIY